MNLRLEEISRIIKEQIRTYRAATDQAEVGTVVLVGDGIARVFGLDNCMANELIGFDGGALGMALNLEESAVSVVLLSGGDTLKEGTVARRTGKVVSVPVGEKLLGRVVDALGQPIDGRGPIDYETTRPIESEAPGIIKRKSVSVRYQSHRLDGADRARTARTHHR